MQPTPLRRTTTRLFLVLAVTGATLVIGAIWAFAPAQLDPVHPSTLDLRSDPRPTDAPPLAERALDRSLLEGVRDVTLVDQLFPPPPPPTPEPVIPDHDASLVAIVSRGETLVAYIRNETSGTVDVCEIGDSIESGAIVRTIEEGAVDLELSGHRLRLLLSR